MSKKSIKAAKTAWSKILLANLHVNAAKWCFSFHRQKECLCRYKKTSHLILQVGERMENGYEQNEIITYIISGPVGEKFNMKKCMIWPLEAWMSELWIQKIIYRNACFFPFLSGIICTCEKLGERASKTSQSKYCNSFGWKQGRPCQQESVGLSGLWCLNSHRRADASCWLYKWDVELFINKQTNMPCRLDFQMLTAVC